MGCDLIEDIASMSAVSAESAAEWGTVIDGVKFRIIIMQRG